STGFNEFSSNIATALVCLATNRVYNFSIMIFDGMDESSGTPTEPNHTPSPKAQQTSPTTHSSPILPPVSTAPIPTVTPSDIPHLRQYTRRARIAQSLVLPPVADELASPLRDVSQGEACPTESGFEADQDRANIAKTSAFPYDLQRQQSEIVSRFEAQELEINSLKARIKLLEDKDKGVAEHSGDDAPIKGRRLDVGEEAAERVSDDTTKMATVLTSMDATTVLASRVAEVPTGSVTLYTRRKGKETMVESKTPKKKKVQEQIDAQVARELEEQMARQDQRMSEQIARDAEIARIHAEEELQIMIDKIARIHTKEELKIMIDGLDRSNETVAKYL
nr:hypothetical protein [Tanacetum cinerariifolium]